MDTARADFAFDRDIMPSLNNLADDGIRVNRCFANAPWTLPSHSSIFSGQRPSDHGVTGKGDFYQVEADLATLLSRHGYTTAGFSNNPWISPDFGFDGFDTFSRGWKWFDRGADLAGISQLDGKIAQLKGIASKLGNRDAPFTIANAIYMRFMSDRVDSGAKRTIGEIEDWVDDLEDENPFFLFANFMEPHLQYDPPEQYITDYIPEGVNIEELKQVNQDPWAYLTGEKEMSERDFEILRGLYKAELAYLDDQLSHLFGDLERHGILDDTVVIVVGDHGEHIGDHDMMDHQYTLCDTLLHVPLFIRFPDEFEQEIETDFDGLVELRDIFPTILELTGVKVPTNPAISSESLQSLVREGGREFVISEYLTPQPAIETLRERYDDISKDISQYDRRLRSIRTESRRYTVSDDGWDELDKFDGESSDSVPRTTDGLRDLLEDTVGTFPAVSDGTCDNVALSDANQEQLEDLGYL